VTPSPDDERRVSGIEAYGALEMTNDPALVEVVRLAATICRVSRAVINLITDTEQHQIAAFGFAPSVSAREKSMCDVTLREAAPVHVRDASQDPRFATNPFVTGELGSVRFYAAHPLETRDGVPFGTLCVFDETPGELDAVQLQALATLAHRVVDTFELGLANRVLKDAMAEVEAARGRLERSNERLQSFAGQITHDLKTPLTTMALSIELLRDELELGATPDDVLPLITRALSGSGRMSQMIEDVLTYARLGSTIDLGPVDLGRLVEEVGDDFAMRGQRVPMEVGPMPTVLGDEALLRALMQNLVSNAIKFTAEDTEPSLRISATDLEGLVRLEVSDNGIGVPDEQKERIFEPMVRLDKTYPGVGIGLATCMRVVDAHEGRIGVVDNTDGPGSTFWVELPN
jgi:signal transduction histidine kinase